MKCSNCDTEYSDSNQIICEICGNDLAKNKESATSKTTSKIDKFLNETGLKELYQKIKKSLKD